MSNGKKIGGIILSVLGGIFLFLALIFGIVFLIVGGAMGNAKDEAKEELEAFVEHAIKTDGEIIDTDGSTTTIEYYSEKDDSYYQATFSVSNSSFREGDSVVVYYDENDPDSCMAPDLVEGTYEKLSDIFSGIGAGLGVFLGIIGLGFLIGGIVLIKKAKPS